jgi:hypothetical protein
MLILSLLRSAAGILALAALTSACTNRATDCKYNANCSDATAAGNGGMSDQGGQGGEAGSDSRGGSSGQGGASTTSTVEPSFCETNPCDVEKPVCDPNRNRCVACLTYQDCGGNGVCDTASGTCVECLAGADCTTPAAAVCNTGTNTCEATCTRDADCSRFDGTNGTSTAPVCNTMTGACVQCTVKNETACGASSCNPATNACTTTPRASIDVCRACVADSECLGAELATPTARCVPMTFGTDTTTKRGSYCLAVATETSCAQPFKVNISATSVSGVAGVFCGINQTATTCEAVLDMGASRSCTADASCGTGVGGLCKDFDLSSASDLRCTIPCGSNDQCTSGKTCSSLTAGYCQ